MDPPCDDERVFGEIYPSFFPFTRMTGRCILITFFCYLKNVLLSSYLEPWKEGAENFDHSPIMLLQSVWTFLAWFTQSALYLIAYVYRTAHTHTHNVPASYQQPRWNVSTVDIMKYRKMKWKLVLLFDKHVWMRMSDEKGPEFYACMTCNYNDRPIRLEPTIIIEMCKTKLICLRILYFTIESGTNFGPQAQGSDRIHVRPMLL